MTTVEDSVAELRAQLQHHTPVDTREDSSMSRMLTQLDRLPAPFDEEADPVHVTASAIVVGPRGTVLHRHKRMKRWLQPGGHIEPGEEPADAALREAEERFRNSFDRAPIGMALLSLEGRWLKVNDALCEIVGHSGAELRARPIAGVAHPDDLDRTLVALGGLATGERAEIKMEERWVHAGGHTIWVQVNASVVTDDVGAPLHFVAQIQDVSERRRTSQYFEAQHAVSRTLAEAASLEHALDEVLPAIGAVMEWSVGALWMTCPDARVIRAERVWCRPGLEDFADATRSLELARGVGLPGRIWKTGEPRWLEDVSGDPHFARKQAATDNALRSAIGLPVVGADGVIGVIEFFSRDIRPPEPEMLSRLVAIGAQVGQYIERQRAEREADRLKNEFFALVSHELRTPLTSMVGYLELLLEEDEGELSSHHRHFLDVIDRNAGRLQRLVGDLLFAAELEAGNLSLEIGRADLGGVVREAVQTLRHRAESRSIELILETEDVPACGGDHDRIGQAVDNLLSNALKYTPEGGRVVVRLLRSGGRAVIEIEDSGIGIPDWEQDRLFERFFRASSATERAIPGVGLGLSIVQAIIDGHGGRVSLESREGVGSRFSIELPLAAPVSGGGTAGLRTVERSPAPDGRLRRPLAPTNASRDRSSSSTAAAPKW